MLTLILALLLPAGAFQQVRIGNDGTIPNAAMLPPTVLESTEPLYTDEARSRGIEGIVTIAARVDATGGVEVLGVLKSLGSGLDESAMSAVRTWKFGPARRNGVPVEVISQIDVSFSLSNASVFRVGSGISAPTVLIRIPPQYTDEARAARYGGKVVLEAIIRQDGTVDINRVVRGLDLGLTEKAVEAIKQWKFTPGLKQGNPVDIKLNIEINFSLR